MPNRRGWGPLLCFWVIAGLLAAAPTTTTAAQTRPFTGASFGPDGVGGTRTFADIEGIAEDASTGDVYVLNRVEEKYEIYKFDASGHPLNFASTGTNVVSGGEHRSSPGELQIAVAPPGSPGGTGGDIYVAASAEPGVVVFSAGGEEIGEFGEPESCGIATNASGRIFVANANTGDIQAYVPTTNPPTAEDVTETNSLPSAAGRLCNVAAVGEVVYVANFGGNEFFKLEGAMDANPTKFEPGGPSIASNPVTGEIYVRKNGEIAVYGPGNELREVFGRNQLTDPLGIASDPASGRVYVGTNPPEGNSTVLIFGTPVSVPTVTVSSALTPKPSEAILRGFVNPEGLAVSECYFEYGTVEVGEHRIKCAAPPPGNSESDPVSAQLSNLETDGVIYHYRLVAADANGSETSAEETFVTAATVVTKPAAPVEESSATVNGEVFPDGHTYSRCVFEYGLVSEAGFPDESPCVPNAGKIPPDFEFHEVSANLNDLRANDARYRYRLTATNAYGTVTGETLDFATSGQPELGEVRALDADGESATLEATVDPRGFGTSYRIEWGPTESYGLIAGEGSLGPEVGPTRITARVSGLTAGTLYHFRVLASNVVGAVSSADQGVESLDACGLPQLRCFELVSPSDAGPVAEPGASTSGLRPSRELAFQVAESPGALAYASEPGLPGATQGAGVLYRAIRGPGGWDSAQISPSITARDETKSTNSTTSRTLGLSPDLSCGVIESSQPLTADSATQQVVEAGGMNLYRMNPDGSYTAVTNRPPQNLEVREIPGKGFFRLVGLSNNCSAIYFTSVYRYPGAEAQGEQPLYEWHEGDVRSVGVVPGENGDVPVQATAGGPSSASDENNVNDLDAVSAKGSRIFFTAERPAGVSEAGKQGLYVSEDGITRDVSASEGPVPDEGATYRYATPDGSRVYFTANPGLTAESSPQGEDDLYEYDLAKTPAEHPLTDLSVAHEPEGAADVAGVIGASEDGSRVYFAALGRLVDGEGLTASENSAQGSYSIYTEADGHIAFVATVTPTGETGRQNLLTSDTWTTTARVSTDGRYLLFESASPATSYPSGNQLEAYIYDDDAQSESITCISCATEGSPKIAEGDFEHLLSVEDYGNVRPPVLPRTLVADGGRSSVVFRSLSSLAPGAIGGDVNLYEWSHGQVFLLSSEPPNLQNRNQPAGQSPKIFSLGADAGGSDLYLATPASLTAEDGDERFSIYDARIGGGFPSTPAPAAPCDPTIEGSCQGSVAPVPSIPGAGTSTAVGRGNPTHAKRLHRRRRKHRRHPKRQGRSGRRHRHQPSKANDGKVGQ